MIASSTTIAPATRALTVATPELIAAKHALVAKLDYGVHTTVALFNAGATWSLIHKLTDAGLIRFEEALTSDSNNQCILRYLITF